MGNILKSIIFGLLVSMLSGCFMFDRDKVEDQEYRDAYYIDLLTKNLAAHNVSVFQNDNSVMINLPSKDFFVNNSANFTNDAYNVLDLILGLSSYYQTSSVAVTGYSSAWGRNYEFNKALAVERARRIVRYLWQSGIDSNYMYSDSKNIVYGNKDDNNVLSSDGVLIVMHKFIDN